MSFQPKVKRSSSVNFWRILAVCLAFLLGAYIAYQHGWFEGFRNYQPENSLMVLEPYRHAGTWVFDDPDTGLRQEPFVQGIPEMIDHMVKDVPNADKGFRLLFSAAPFPGYQLKLVKRQGDRTGTWYYCEELGYEGWLCPALFKYFRMAPDELYGKAEPRHSKPSAVTPSPTDEATRTPDPSEEPDLRTPAGVMVIRPYRHAGTWVFDDPDTGLVKEPFVQGIPEMIDYMVKDVPDADKGFRLLFSAQEFPGYTLKLVWKRGDRSGNWYQCEQLGTEGWLCPALFKYFRKAPDVLYGKAEAR